jgi:hypothetical protein
MIKGYIHVAVMGTWNQILREQLDLIRKSGLYDRVDQIELCTLGDGEFEDDGKIKWVNQGTNIRLHEFPTLNRLYENATDGLSFYIHLKGVSKTKQHWLDKSKFYNDFAGLYDLKALQRHERLWRKYMEYFAIEQHQECINLLREYDICGVHWREKPYPHYSGNFWWAKDDYIRRLVRPDEFLKENDTYRDIMGSNRALAEFWIGSGDPKVGILFNNDMDLYNKPMLPHIYKKIKLF